MKILNSNSRPLKELVLLDAQCGDDMHPGIAVVNVLALMAKVVPLKCLQDWGKLVLPATVNAERTQITIGEETFDLRIIPDAPHQERCLSGKRPGRDGDEAYWILNPAPLNSTLERLVIKCEVDRHTPASCLKELEDYCRTSPLACIKGIHFKE